MKKIVDNFWFRLILGLCTTIAGALFIIDPSFVEVWLVRIIGGLWVFEGIEHFLAARIIKMKTKIDSEFEVLMSPEQLDRFKRRLSQVLRK